MLIRATHPPLLAGLLQTLLLPLALWLLLLGSSLDFASLFTPGTLTTLGRFAADFLPPASDGFFLRELGNATLTTVAVANLGMALAIAIGVPLALLSSRVLIGDAPLVLRWLAPPIRALLLVLRGVPELVWALLFVRAVGLGSMAALLALGLAYGGMLGKVYAEILESQPQAPLQALRQAGGGRIATLVYGLLPNALPELVSYTVYRWECAIRASAVMGLVGAGGLGQLMDTSVRMLNGGEVGAILLVFMVLVLLTEIVSWLVRRSLAAADPRRDAAVAAPGWMLAGKPLLSLALLVLVLFASGGWLARDWVGGFDLAALFGRLGEFFPADLSREHLQAVAKAGWETLVLSVWGTALALIGAAVLALPASGAYGLAARLPARAILNFLRAVPDLLWAAIAVLAAGIGPLAGVIALALHTTGVLGRLYAETLENAAPEPAQALRMAGANRLLAFCYGTLPVVAGQWIAYALYRWEVNIRIAAVMGFVGAGGLGQMLHLTLSLFQMPQAATVIAATLLLAWLAESFSARLRRGLQLA